MELTNSFQEVNHVRACINFREIVRAGLIATSHWMLGFWRPTRHGCQVIVLCSWFWNVHCQHSSGLRAQSMQKESGTDNLIFVWPLFIQWQSRCGSKLQPKLNVNKRVAKMVLKEGTNLSKNSEILGLSNLAKHRRMLWLMAKLLRQYCNINIRCLMTCN